jgi:hypothetical protein
MYYIVRTIDKIQIKKTRKYTVSGIGAQIFLISTMFFMWYLLLFTDKFTDKTEFLAFMLLFLGIAFFLQLMIVSSSLKYKIKNKKLTTYNKLLPWMRVNIDTSDLLSAKIKLQHRTASSNYNGNTYQSQVVDIYLKMNNKKVRLDTIDLGDSLNLKRVKTVFINFLIDVNKIHSNSE